MKTSLRRNIGQDLAIEIVNQIAQNVGQMIKSNFDSTPVFWWDESIGNWHPDGMSFGNNISWPAADILQLECHSGSGEHLMILNVRSGDIIVSTDGYRNSYPGNGMDFIREIYPENGGIVNYDLSPFDPWGEINNIEDWEVLDVSTSQPDWAIVTGWLKGKIGKGPINKWEHDNQVAERKISALKEKLETIGKEIPPNLWWDSENGFHTTDLVGVKNPWRPRFTGLEYRRAAANGIRL